MCKGDAPVENFRPGTIVTMETYISNGVSGAPAAVGLCLGKSSAGSRPLSLKTSHQQLFLYLSTEIPCVMFKNSLKI